MSYAQQMRDVLEPLGIYQWEDSFQWAALSAKGASFDLVAEELEELQREMNLVTAGDWGLEKIYSLLSRKPLAESGEDMALALAALLRTGDRSFTLEAISDTISGCGVHAAVEELDEVGKVKVYFPDVGGIPSDFSEISYIIETIIPCHLEIEYYFWFITWAEVEEKFSSWNALEAMEMTWEEFEKYVPSTM